MFPAAWNFQGSPMLKINLKFLLKFEFIFKYFAGLGQWTPRRGKQEVPQHLRRDKVRHDICSLGKSSPIKISRFVLLSFNLETVRDSHLSHNIIK